MPKRARSGKVPPPGKAVNEPKNSLIGGEGLAPSAAKPDIAGSSAAARQGWQEICPGCVKIPTKRRFFPVYQKTSANITMAGVQMRNR